MSVATHFPTVFKLRNFSFRKLRHTPLIDLVRGRLSGRLDLREVVRASALPAPVQEKVIRVARRTRLWRVEKVAVAKELLAHFADGLDAGETSDNLVEKFGDERMAAKLIRRAKRRGRPIAWHALGYATRALAVILVIYLLATARLFIGAPSPKVNYVAELNRSVSRVPETDRGWPLYRKAILSLRGPDGTYDHKLLPLTSEKNWPAQRGWLTAHAEALAQARAAAAKPTLGFVWGPDGSANDPELYPKVHLAPVDGSPGGQPLYEVLLPHLNDLRMISNALAADARLAREQKDAARDEADIAAMIRMADQIHAEGAVFVTDLVSLATRSDAMDAIEATLLLAPPDAAGLQRLAHLLVRPAGQSDVLSFDGERKTFYDLIQRIYTDNGAGDGHMTWSGIKLGTRFDPHQDKTVLDSQITRTAAAPIVTASRKELVREFDDYMAAAAAQMAKPLRLADWAPVEARMQRWHTERVRYWPLTYTAPAISRVHQNVEVYLGRREGLLLGIVLEAYRQKNGRYPDTLDVLAPDYLKGIPVDRHSGGPLHYKVAEGKPLIYGVGADGDDDGGKVPVTASGRPNPWRAAMWHSRPGIAADGDWRLYPSYPEPPDDGDDTTAE